METADNCRRAACDAVADVEPPQLHDLVETVLDGASMLPGALTIASATTAASDATGPFEEPTGDDPDRELAGVVTHAAGVQLIYEGLRLTRTLAREEPWTQEEPTADADTTLDASINADTRHAAGTETTSDADLEVLAADILVARGFYLLARTEAAGTAVRTVQAFGRDQTRRHELTNSDVAFDEDVDGEPDTTTAAGSGTDPAAIDANLERDVLELAVRTGAAAVDGSPSSRLLAFTDELAETVGTSFPPAEEYRSDLEPGASDPSLEDSSTDRATSATDP
ncbi:DUF7114 family protein [Halopiger djelfimassiliensis]|uniref:DUF7114 family protein n=1 Tax=Halopiger djelfimassiliensis TaxID=1293047 RepID=UPI0006777A12|nr:hypothetical protein [Halopiger djelfimassiliensis]